MKWDAWGDPAAAKPLSDGIAALLQQALGVSGDNVPAVGLADVRLRPSHPVPADRTGLAAIVGDAHYADDDRSGCCAPAVSRLNLLQRKDFRTAGRTRCGTGTRIRRRGRRDPAVLLRAPDRRGAVRRGHQRRGRRRPGRGRFTAVVSLDLYRFDQLLSLDETSGEAVLKPA
jgi:alkyldihydroxyacetonephosphate synthase